jgi:hypothetical protein
MRIGLIPLDERPVNTRYPAMVASIAGVDLCLPPFEALSARRAPAPVERLGEWLRDAAGGLDALVVSCEMLAHGGLVASRITGEPPSDILARLDALRQIKQHFPSLYVAGFTAITRVSNADSAFEEPAYWAKHGVQMYQLSQLLDLRIRLGHAVEGEIAALNAALPPESVADFTRRRLRNHTVNLSALHLLAEGVFDLLVVSFDDTSVYGLPSREKQWLAGWGELIAAGERLLMYPGADEVGTVLVMRLVNAAASQTPHFAVLYAVPGGEAIVAPYEDAPIAQTIARQIDAVGGQTDQGETDGALWLAINPPVERQAEWHPDFAAAEAHTRRPHLETVVEEARQRLASGQSVSFADVAYPNGADPVLIDLLCEWADLRALSAYGAWNTAGNTVGVVVAEACAAQLAETADQRDAQTRFLLHRFIEDWGYQHVVRRQVREWLLAQTCRCEPTPDILGETNTWVEARLQALVDQLPGLAGRYKIKAGSVRLPWARTFEVDFDLVAC